MAPGGPSVNRVEVVTGEGCAVAHYGRRLGPGGLALVDQVVAVFPDCDRLAPRLLEPAARGATEPRGAASADDPLPPRPEQGGSR